MSSQKSLLSYLGDLSISFVIALLLFAPITGVQLQGFDFVTHTQRPLLLASIVCIGRFFVLLLTNTAKGQALMLRCQPKPLLSINVPRSAFSRISTWLICGLILSLPFIFLDNNYLSKTMILALIYVLLGLGLNIVVGWAGLLDLGYVAFYAVGAYLLALGFDLFGIGFWTALILSPLCAAILGGLLAFPVLRTHGDYLAIVTLGFGEIIRLILTNWVDVTGGPMGKVAPAPTLFGLEFSRSAKGGGMPFHQFFGLEYNSNYKFLFIYTILVCVVTVMVFFAHRLRTTPTGRLWEALREDEIACKSLGINPVKIKLSAFMMGAMTGGIAGVFFATYQGFVSPTSFTFFESIIILAIVVLGGLGSIRGVIIAAFILTLLPELLRSFADIRVLTYGLLMILIMIWRPKGLIQTPRPSEQDMGMRS